MSARHNARLCKAIERSRRTLRCQHIGDQVIVFERCRNLTAFAAMRGRKFGSELAVDYELGLTVMTGDEVESGAASLEAKLRTLRYVAAPMVLPAERFGETITRDAALTDWLESRIVADLRGRTLPRAEALALIAGGADGFVEKLRRIFGAVFDETIIAPLLRMG